MDAPEPSSGSSAVARYYDRNTRRFLLIGRAGSSHGIHRQLWGPGVSTPEQAANYVNILLEREIRGLDPDRAVRPTSLDEHLTVLDLGCGVGGTLFHLAKVLPDSHSVGVTISQRQLEIAKKLNEAERLQDRVHFERADFHTMRLAVKADVAIAVESFAHSDAPAHFFKSAAEHLRPDGHLILVDDFLADDEALLSEKQQTLVQDFRRGWHVRSVCSVKECREAATQFGLELTRDVDLSSLIRPGRPRDKVIARLSPLFRRLRLAGIPFFDNMMGGNALQVGLKEGFIEHRMLGFRKGRVG